MDVELTSTTLPAVARIRPRRIKTRRIDFSYPAGSLPKHYMAGDPAMSHLLAVLSSVFPEGEDFFVRSVRNYRDQIADPELKQQVAGFIGQEAIHGREHRNLNIRLQAMGYPTLIIDRLTKWGLYVARILPKSTQLAATAALEHYTATMAEVILGDERMRAQFGDNEVRSMFLWHALEESEHKSVAYDVYETVTGNHFIRTAVMNVITVAFVALMVLGTLASMLLDSHTYRHPIKSLRSYAAIRRSPWFERASGRRIRDYNRRDFHPDDNDATALLEEWRAKLFGQGGSLSPRLKAGVA